VVVSILRLENPLEFEEDDRRLAGQHIREPTVEDRGSRYWCPVETLVKFSAQIEIPVRSGRQLCKIDAVV